MHGFCTLVLVRREQDSPVSRLKERAVTMKDRNEIKKSREVLAHHRQDSRYQSSRIHTDNQWTVSARPIKRCNSAHREPAGRDLPSGRLVGNSKPKGSSECGASLLMMIANLT